MASISSCPDPMKDDLELVLAVTGPYLDSYLANGKAPLTIQLFAVYIKRQGLE